MTTDATAYNGLSQRRRLFVDGVISGMSQTAAYVAAGYADDGAKQNASRLMTFDDVATAIETRRSEAANAAAWDRDRVTQEWLTNLSLARDGGHHAASNTALTALVRHIGLDVPAPVDPAASGVTLTARLSVAELRGVVEVLRLKEAGEVVDVTATVTDGDESDG